MKNKILVSGSLVYDKIMDFKGKFSDHIMADKIHSLSVCFLVDKLKINFGGTAGNIAYNLKLLGEEPIILSQAGADFGDYSKWLKKNKICMDGIKLINSKNTASAHIVTDTSDNQITALHLETMGVASGINERKIKSFGRAFIGIVSPGNAEDMMSAARVYKKLGIAYIADPGQQIPALNSRELGYLVKDAYGLMCNDYELELIMKKLGLRSIKSLEKLVGFLVVTLGAKGSVIHSQGKRIKIPVIKPRRVVDPTGAGDAYRAGFIKGLSLGFDLEKSGKLGSWVAKFPVEYYGTQEHSFKFKK
jgi:adenosine kinase